MIRDFLDDFALVVSGNGGKDNVSAACVEVSDQGRANLLRVSRNEGVIVPSEIGFRPNRLCWARFLDPGPYQWPYQTQSSVHRGV
jgi:hypothetical protein